MSVSVIPEFEEAVELEAVADPKRLHDSRGDVPITETTERFLRALLSRVPIERIEELYLFAPLRQGAVETGIAVIAARAVVVEPVVTPDVVAEAEEPAIVGEAAIIATTETEVEVEVLEVEVEEFEAAAADEAAAEDSPYAPEVTASAAESEPEPTELPAQPEAEQQHELPGIPAPERHTVYTARYRLVVKGPDRGKWEIDVVDEADAPLLTVETVVRGVQRRAGEETATVRYDAAQLAHVLHLEPHNAP